MGVEEGAIAARFGDGDGIWRRPIGVADGMVPPLGIGYVVMAVVG